MSERVIRTPGNRKRAKAIPALEGTLPTAALAPPVLDDGEHTCRSCKKRPTRNLSRVCTKCLDQRAASA